MPRASPLDFCLAPAFSLATTQGWGQGYGDNLSPHSEPRASLQKSRSWCWKAGWVKLLRQPSASTLGCWSTTPTCSSCSSKYGPKPGPQLACRAHSMGQARASMLCSLHRCRQFVEMVNGTDSEVRSLSSRSPKSQDSYPGSPSLSPRHGPSSSHIHNTGQPFSRVLWEGLVWGRVAIPHTFLLVGLELAARLGGRERDYSGSP